MSTPMMSKREALKHFNVELRAAKARCLAYQKEHGYLHSKKVKEEAEQLDRFVRADDPRIHGSVTIAHQDGSHFFFNHAWYEKFGRSPLASEYNECGDVKSRSDWIVVFTEHAGVHHFSIGDLSHYQRNVRDWKR